MMGDVVASDVNVEGVVGDAPAGESDGMVLQMMLWVNVPLLTLMVKVLRCTGGWCRSRCRY